MVFLSEFYKFFEQYHLQGHSIGRKLGDLLEIITMEYLNHNLREHITIENEQLIDGYSGASHKVEFKLSNNEGMVGLIECKRVGVEVTSVYNKFLQNKIKIYDNKIQFKFSVENNELKVNFLNLSNTQSKSFKMKVNQNFQIVIVDNEGNKIDINSEHVISPDENISSISGKIKSIRIFKLVRLDPLNFALKKAFPHPATIEKAKQIGFVALDVRKKELDIWGKDDLAEGLERTFISVLVITELSHWDEKSISVINCSLDYILVIPDNIWINLVKEIINKVKLENFNTEVRMKNYLEGEIITDITRKICELYDYNIFTNIHGESQNISIDSGYIVIE